MYNENIMECEVERSIESKSYTYNFVLSIDRVKCSLSILRTFSSDSFIISNFEGLKDCRQMKI